jgi:hypothetical protein
MSSNMTQIDEGFIQYPVPGIDNDSQGFRDRYSTIRTNLNTAREELGNLITNTAKINTNNNFGGNKIINANLSSTTLEANTAEDGSPITANTLSISWLDGSVHVIRVGEGEDNGQGGQVPLSLSFTNFPAEADKFVKITVIVNADAGVGGAGRNLAWPANAMFNYNPALNSIGISGTKIFEVFTYETDDSGTTLFVNYLGLYE